MFIQLLLLCCSASFSHLIAALIKVMKTFERVSWETWLIATVFPRELDCTIDVNLVCLLFYVPFTSTVGRQNLE